MTDDPIRAVWEKWRDGPHPQPRTVGDELWQAICAHVEAQDAHEARITAILEASDPKWQFTCGPDFAAVVRERLALIETDERISAIHRQMMRGLGDEAPPPIETPPSTRWEREREAWQRADHSLVSETRWRCRSCLNCVDATTMLRAPSPFEPDHTLTGCPVCKVCDEGFDELCDELGCDEVTCAGTPTATGYRRTCHQHVPKELRR